MSEVSELQRFADATVAPEYRQPLKTLEEAMAVHDWPFVDHPDCCGNPITVRDFIGCPYFGGCNTCGKFVASVDAPQFEGGAVTWPDHSKFPEDTDWERRWIAGVGPTS